MTAGAPTDRFERVLWFVAYFGLHQLPSDLSPTDLATLAGDVRALLKKEQGVPTKIITDAIQYGLPYTFPISENGYFDGKEAARYMGKAKAAASKLRTMGKLPMTPESAEARLERMAAEDEWND
jgi:hypothetical protein